jgi:microcystin degradation protein MlrC
MTDSDSKPTEYLTLFEKERGMAFTRSALWFNAADVPPLAARALAIAKAERMNLESAAERVAPSVWDEAANHYTCAYDLRKAIVRHAEHLAAKERKAASKPRVAAGMDA